MNKSQKKAKRLTLSILIPCHNEEKMITACLDSCLDQTRKLDQIVVVNDGSTDGTSRILKRFKKQHKRRIKIVSIPTATGNKSRAQEVGINYIKTDIVIMTDADTVLDRDFVRLVEKDFVETPEISVVSGYVKSMKNNYLTALRDIDYIIGQNIYKQAQANFNLVLVIPGCAGAFRTDVFKKGVANFEHDTLTEDLDFTYKIHKARLGIKFNTKATVYTQDPFTLRSYTNQMRRWFGGQWQNLVKHRDIILKLPISALVLPMMYIESLLFSIVLFTLPFLNIVLFYKLLLFLIIVGVVTALTASIIQRRFDLVLYSPLYVVVIVINSYVFFEQFVAECIL